MDFFKSAMKIPTRPAPAVPNLTANKYSPVTNWDDDPFGAEVFEPTPQQVHKKKPPPRPPPPKINQQTHPKQPHFKRRPTVLDSLLNRRAKNSNSNLCKSVNNQITELNSDVCDAGEIFRKCESKSIHTATLIDLSSPPSSPTFTTRSSSDGLSIDSFGSDATNSTNHHQVHCGSSSQAESGFEDDFEFILNSKRSQPTNASSHTICEDLAVTDPFSPHFQNKSNNIVPISSLKGPTIIRGKPARPRPPSGVSLLHNAFESTQSMVPVNVNMTTPLQKITCGSSSLNIPPSWEVSNEKGDRSPPMPNIPPPPPPVVTDDNTQPWAMPDESAEAVDPEEPYGIALFDYSSEHPDDLNFSANAKIKLIRRVNQEWMFGSLRSGIEGLFPANYIEIRVPLPDELLYKTATALYDFPGEEPTDLPFKTGDKIVILHQLNETWYYGSCNNARGQIPSNYVQIDSS